LRNEIRHIAKKLVWRIPLLVLILIGANYVYSEFFWEKDVWDRGQMYSEVKALQDSTEILYFGESSNFSYHPIRDRLEDRISDFVSYHFPDVSFGTINHAAYHAGLYVPLIKQIDGDSKVRTIIVTLNLRTFGQAVTHSPLETSMQQEKVLFGEEPPLLKRLYLTLNHFDNKTELERDKIKWEEWTYDTLESTVDSIQFQSPTIRSWCEVVKFPDEIGVEDMQKRALADHYIKAYAFQLNEENPRVRDFDEIVDLCREKDINLVLNVLAENIEYADSLVGSNLTWLIRENKNFIKKRYENKGAIVVDNLESVAGFHFTDQHWTTEHYDQIGRQVIARNVALAVRELYPNSYSEIKIDSLFKEVK